MRAAAVAENAMTWGETVRTGLEAVLAHRMRSVLTMLGIVIGVSSVILTVGLGQGAQDEVRKQIDSLGSNLLVVSPGSTTSSTGVRGGFGSASSLTLSDARAIADTEVVPDVAAVAPVMASSSALVSEGTNWTTTLVGTTVEWLDVRSRTLSSGRFFTHGEVASGARVVVLGPDTVEELGLRSPVGQTLTVNGSELTVIGVLESAGGSSSDASLDDTAVTPIPTAASVTGNTGTTVSSIYVEGNDQETLGAAHAEITALLTNLHGVTTADAASPSPARKPCWTPRTRPTAP